MALIKVYKGNEDLTAGEGTVVEKKRIPEIIAQGFTVIVIRNLEV